MPLFPPVIEEGLNVTTYFAQPVPIDAVPTYDSAPGINAALAAGVGDEVFIPNGAYLLGRR